MNRTALLTVGQILNGESYLLSIYDYEPSGIIVHAYNQTDSKEYKLPITEAELIKSGHSRKEESLKSLISTMFLSQRGSEVSLQSTNTSISVQKSLPTGDDLDAMMKSSTEGVPSVHDLLVTGLVELCKEKPVGIEAVKWLGEWLLANNPNKPRVDGPDDDE